MALQTPNNLYSGGAVVFNTAPSTALAMNIMARRQAKQDALDQYYREQDMKLNPAGMDVRYDPVLRKAKDDMANFWTQNKEKLLRPYLDKDGSAQTGYNSLFQRSQSIINEGKQAAIDRKADLDRMMELNKSDMLTPDIKQQYSNAYDLPLDHKKWKPLDRSVFLDAQKPYDNIKETRDAYQNVKLSEGNEYGPTDPKTLQRTITTKYDYNDEAKKQIQSIAAVRYNTVPHYQKLINSLITDPTTFERVNDYSKQAYGHTIDIAHPEQFAAAYDLMNLPKGNVKQAKEIDPIAKDKMNFGQQKELAAINFNNQKTLRSMPTWKELNDANKTKDDDNSGAYNVLSSVANAVRNGGMNISSPGLGIEKNPSVVIDDPEVLKHFKGLAPLSGTPGKNNFEQPTAMHYNPLRKKLEVTYVNEDGAKTTKDVNPEEYLRIKVKESFPNKEIGGINNIVSKLYDESGGDLIKMVDNFQRLTTPTQTAPKAKSKTQTGAYDNVR